MTTQHTEYEHNEEHDANSVDETVVTHQDTPNTSVTDDTASSSDDTSSENDVFHNDTSPTHAEHNDNASATEPPSSTEETDSLAAAAFAEETGNTIPELSAFVNVEDPQTPVTQEEASSISEQDNASTASADDIHMPVQEAAPSTTTEDIQTSVAQEETLSTSDTASSDVQNTEVTSPEKTEPAQEPLVAQTEQDAFETVDVVAAPVFMVESETVVAEVMPAAETSEEAVRPFTAFIEEFHQAEAEAEAQAEAHLTASLQSPQAEGFSEFATPEMDATAVDQPISLEEALPPVDFGEGSAFVPDSEGPPTVNATDENTQLIVEAAASEENQRVGAVTETNQAEEALPETQRPERPVSPLLRPALRPRPARHGVTRHRDEPAVSAPAPTATVETAVTTQSAQEASTAPEEPKETAKPPRRYRFDRPAPQVAQASQTQAAAPVSKPVPPTPTSVNNNVVLTPPPATQPTPTFARVEESQATALKTPTVSTPATSVVGTTEQQSGEPASMESTISSPTEQVRRRHSSERQERHPRQEREKEQSGTSPIVAPASVADIATALGSESKADDVAPEDMPPLEYAELQKANSSRRRRRHRTAAPGTPAAKETVTSTNGTLASAPLAPVAPITPITAVAQNGTAVKPSAPATPVTNPYTAPTATTPPYTITSGYTVGQMNQGNEESGPFMGPEPSPARGSVNTTRDGRTVRVESQPQRSAPYQTRAVEGMLPAAAMNHFANIVSQAIQTQSDRMVAELRRANQAPTNVSVSLPPFPSTERVGVFVDVANLLYSARTQRIAIDFGKLLDFLRGNRRLIRAHAYCPTSPQPGDEQMFLTAVKGLGYRITTKNYKTFASGAKKADLDLDLCMDVVRIVDGGAVDCIVLVSGDSDFMPMLDYCSDHGVRVEVAAFDEAMSATLRQSCDLFVNLSMLEEIRA